MTLGCEICLWKNALHIKMFDLVVTCLVMFVFENLAVFLTFGDQWREAKLSSQKSTTRAPQGKENRVTEREAEADSQERPEE